ncbi:hypothetical protein PMAYCL1PPCAC_13769, partial [Pristionchus mayeri]
FQRQMNDIQEYKAKDRPYGFTTDAEKNAPYSMPPAVTTMPMKAKMMMKNESMGTEGGWSHRKFGGSTKSFDPSSIPQGRKNGKTNDEDWFENEYSLDEKGKKRQEGWTLVKSNAMVVSTQNASWVVWMKEGNRVITMKSMDLYLSAWADMTYLWNEKKTLIDMKKVDVADSVPEGIELADDIGEKNMAVTCVVDFIASEDTEATPPRLESPVFGVVEIHDEEVYEKIWCTDYFMKKLKIEAEFRLEDTGDGHLSGNWVMTTLRGVVGVVEQPEESKKV